jgi:hypothetical protein
MQLPGNPALSFFSDLFPPSAPASASTLRLAQEKQEGVPALLHSTAHCSAHTRLFASFFLPNGCSSRSFISYLHPFKPAFSVSFRLILPMTFFAQCGGSSSLPVRYLRAEPADSESFWKDPRHSAASEPPNVLPQQLSGNAFVSRSFRFSASRSPGAARSAGEASASVLAHSKIGLGISR